MKIGIDARFLSHPQPGGFKTYTVNLISALAAADIQNEYVLYTDRPMSEVSVKLPVNFKTRIVPGDFPGIGMVIREQILLPLYAKWDRLDVFHSPCLTAPLRLHCPLVVTLHDMIWHWPDRFASATSQGLKRRLQALYNEHFAKLAAKHADAIITVSQSANVDLQRELQIPWDRIIVTLEAAPLKCQRVTDDTELKRVRAKFSLPSNYAMAIGSADPRKNILSLIEAYSKLAPEIRQQFPLVIVWTHSWLSAEAAVWVEQRNLTGQVRFLEWASNEDMYALYSMADLFVFPSRYEGFGLPLLEAMVCGAPVATANNSSIPEVVGDAAVLFDADQPDTIAAAMQQLLSSEDARREFIARGYKQASQFSWEHCANETRSVYTNLQNNPVQVTEGNLIRQANQPGL